ncbi:uncharacterized protein [Aegilops tauschii subsp. strangulata]|uniref:uncharacterized protein n=1 Tax=Aegilops tauschii subsp. strangulata TaxID=200361 RepID=UPI00098A5CAC|nr:uncharacterized protein LOC120970910 [Aegilops tauschii subsp. strangulata]
MTQKKRPRRRRSPREGPSRRRRGEEGASLSGSLVESDSSSTTSSAPPSGSFDKPAGRTSSAPPSGSLDEPPVAWPARQSRYHEILASRLVRLQLQAGVAIDSPNLPSDQIVQVLARSNFYDDELRAALVEYQVHKFLSEPHGPDVGDTHFGEDSGDDITAEEFVKYSGQLKTRRPAEIDTKTGLDQEQLDSLLAKYKRYRFKAYLLLLGKPVDELEEAALESKYPMELALENDFFYPCHHDSAFGWYFDSDLCLLANLSDYQRLVLPNRGRNEYEYDRWSQYKAFCNTPDADREYVLYWEKMVKEMKWLENHVLKDFLEWEPMRCKGLYQSVKIASGFTNIDLDLACHGFEEYVWRTRLYRLFVEGLDRAFLEIWKRVNEDQTSFRDALQEVYNDNPVPSRRHTLKAELERPGGFLQLERQFRRCTEGISKEVNLPDERVQELIAQEINYKRALPKTYAQYARQKLQVAEVLGIIPRAEIPA